MLATEKQGTTVLRDYAYGDQLLTMLAAGSAYYYHHDTLGTTAAITKQTGATEWTYTYTPYGEARTTTKVDPNAPDNPIQYTSELIDPETGLYDLRARTYNPADGHFLTTDPLDQDAGDPAFSVYLYANAEPLLFSDPSGQYAIDEDANGNTIIIKDHPCPGGGGTWYQDPSECRDPSTSPPATPDPGTGGSGSAADPHPAGNGSGKRARGGRGNEEGTGGEGGYQTEAGVSADAGFVAESEIIANAEARLLEVLKNPMAFTGHDPSRLLAQLVQDAKDAGWRVADVKSGEGIRIYRPGSGDTDVIRLMKSGQPGAPRDTMQAGPRLVVSRSGALQHVPLKGNPTLK
jgi:RHS repeat-associated protein